MHVVMTVMHSPQGYMALSYMSIMALDLQYQAIITSNWADLKVVSKM